MSSLPSSCNPHQPEGHTLGVQIRKLYQAPEAARFQLDIKFEIRPGVTILLGHSGAGKTTVLRCIAGLCDPQEGCITLGSKVLFDSQRRIRIETAQRRVGFVFQDLALFPHLTVRENVAYGLRSLDAEERSRRVNKITESFQIAHLHHRFPREISGGEQQRVALARSLVTEPCALLLDEPMSSLDVQTKSGIIDDLRTWNETRRIPMLYVTHNHEEVFALGEHVIALKQGRVIAEGAPLDIVPKARRETMVQFAGFENLLEANVIRIQEQHGTVICRLTKKQLELEAPLTRVEVGAPVHIGIRAGEILLASSRPELVGACNVISGSIKKVHTVGSKVEVVVDCGVELRVHLPVNAVNASALTISSEAWLIVQPHFCHLISRRRFRALQRLFLFVCSGNTSRSPVAQAICNAELAHRLKVSLPALRDTGVQALSAGLSATPGEPMSIEAEQALIRLGIPVFKHRSQKVSEELVARAEVIFCMTEQQRRNVIEMFPSAAEKTRRLAADLELEDPKGKGSEAYLYLAEQIQHSVHSQMETLMDVTEVQLQTAHRGI
ncbi:MAG TPA: ATP-binding cassette domain-containing protein [Candidatus Angelobacter sp.]|nr:ATP-binding cassette domain-containing protein [Candidatus Angelobacter sp.]